LAHVQATLWDARAFARAAVVATLALAVAWLITAATDEGGVAWGERAGRTLPLTPVCAAVGAGIALAPVRTRGEGRALAALGRSRVQVAAAAVSGGALVALAAALAIGALSAVNVAGFYPTATHASTWQWDHGEFVDRAQGVRVRADGVPESFERASSSIAPPQLPRGGRAAAAIATALAGVAFPLLLAHALLRPPAIARGPEPYELARDQVTWIAVGIAVAASIVLFQAAAAHRVPSMLGTLPPAALLAFAVWRYRAFP
jgi:hypothetical protein